MHLVVYLAGYQLLQNNNIKWHKRMKNGRKKWKRRAREDERNSATEREIYEL